MKTQCLVTDDHWEAIEPPLPEEPPKPKGGRPRVTDRAVLGGIAFVLRSESRWRLSPKELAAAAASPAGGGWRLACVRCLASPARAALELSGRRGRDRLEPSEPGQPQRPGKKGGVATGPKPTGRGKADSKCQLVVDRTGVPLAVLLSAANAHDVSRLLPLIDAISPIIGPR